MDKPRFQLSTPETAEWMKGASLPTIQLHEEPLAGKVLEGRYQIKRELGRGGFGVVYLALDQKMVSRPVVVKVLLDPGIGDEWSVKKFQQEIEALARVDHPSIVGIFDAGELPDGKPYLVMQYVEGISMRSDIKPEGMDFVRAANIIRQIGRALSAAHSKGVFHRDLKPENIMLRPMSDGDEQVKIIDFGVAKVRNSVVSLSTGKERAVGTIAYMSPEQLSALPLTAASDVYSFGVMAYEMLTGRRPSNPESVYQLLEMQRSGVRVKPIDLRPGLPQAAQEIILKALSFEPQDRFQRAREFGDQLAWALIEDDERTKLQSEIALPPETESKAAPGARQQSSETLVLETAHVLFLDMVGYSTLLIDEQPTRLRSLQDIIRNTGEFCRAQAAKQLMRLPTGDGMALVFFGDPEAPLRCALEISQALRNNPEIRLRMGVHSGLVYRVADINTNMNVAGGGINIAQRVMDCGDAGHILLSKRVADDLSQLGRWAGYLHDLGEAEVKHGLRVHIFNLYTDELGNREIPNKLRVASPGFLTEHFSVIRASVFGLALVVAVGLLALSHRSKLADPLAHSGAATAGKEQSLAYWLTVQKMYNKKPLGDPIESTGDQLFGNGWKFRFNLRPMQAGALYLLNVGPGKNGVEEYNILFPTPNNNGGNAKLEANETLQSGWYYFVEQTGVEKLWLIWSAQPIAELDAIFSEAAKNKESPGSIADADQIAKVQSYLKNYVSGRPEATSDKSKKLTFVKGRGDILVSLVELSHEAY
jgi:serine/threonine protein kinase